MKNEIKRIVLASLLTALSIVINLTQVYLIPTGSGFTFPFYQIPLFMAGLLLGQSYVLLVAIVADLGIGMFTPYGYLPLFTISKVCWALVPAIMLYKKDFNVIKLAIAVILSYLLATFSNSLALYIYYGRHVFKLSLIYRIIQLLITSPVIVFIVTVILKKLKHTNYLPLKNFVLIKKDINILDENPIR